MKTFRFTLLVLCAASTLSIHAQFGSMGNEEDHPGGWDFSIPFLSTNRKANNGTVDIQYIENRTNRAPYPHCTSFQFGFISGIDEASGLKIDMGQSFELELRNLVAFSSRLGKWTFFNLGFGVDWRNYRMTGHNQFLLNDDGRITLAPYPAGANPDFSRIHTFSLVYRCKSTLPLEAPGISPAVLSCLSTPMHHSRHAIRSMARSRKSKPTACIATR